MTPAPPPTLIYRFAWVKSLRMLMRMKVLQIGGGLGVVLPATQLLGPSGSHGAAELGALAGLSCGIVAFASTCSWYCERLVQELRVLDGRRLRISTLTMWGHRKDREFELSACEPTYGSGGPEAAEAAKAMVPLRVDGITFLLIRHPLNLVHPRALHRLLCGLPPVPDGQTSAGHVYAAAASGVGASDARAKRQNDTEA
jgi:hypothetical protein